MEQKQESIKIFVSRRIDLESVTVENPLFIPVRCGAVFDTNKDSPYLGDDTGDNISEKRMSYSELTVQYWAWKNEEADCYGICHYRRYLSFADKQYQNGAHGPVMWPLLDQESMRRFGLLDEKRMRELITRYDLIYPCGAPVSGMIPPKGRASTVRELWDAHNGVFFADGFVDRVFAYIDELAPEYSASARAYFESDTHLGYNCFIMRRELFERLCRLQFPIMEALEKELKETGRFEAFGRAPAYAAEMLIGIFMYHVTKKENWRCCSRQLVMFEVTEPVRSGAAKQWYVIRHVLDTAVWKSTLWLFPLGSRRREACKKLYRSMTGRH